MTIYSVASTLLYPYTDFEGGLHGMPLVSAVITGLVLLVFSEISVAQDLNRGLRNYRALVSGQKTIEQLSADETNEILIIMRLMRSQTSSDRKSPECREALDRAESARSELEQYSKRLTTCAANRDFNDDCATEYRRVKNAHSEYEDAVSNVQSFCT